MFRLKIEDGQRYLELDVHDEKSDSLDVILEPLTEDDLISSGKIRFKTKRVARALYRKFREQTRIYARSILHNMAGTQSQIKQTIERYTKNIDRGMSFVDRKKELSKIISSDPDRFSDDLFFLEQRAVDLDAQLIGISLLVGKDYELDLSQTHLIKGLLLRCAYPFLDILHENQVGLDFHNLDKIEVRTDFRLFNCAMYHFFDNIKKYIQPISRINIFLREDLATLSFEMKSRALETGEEVMIFHEGFCGKNSRDQKGEGLGMFIFYTVLAKLKCIPSVSWKEQSRTLIDKNVYQTNVFSIKFPEKFFSKGDTSVKTKELF